jgi:hypothetical protein
VAGLPSNGVSEPAASEVDIMGGIIARRGKSKLGAREIQVGRANNTKRIG